MPSMEGMVSKMPQTVSPSNNWGDLRSRVAEMHATGRDSREIIQLMSEQDLRGVLDGGRDQLYWYEELFLAASTDDQQQLESHKADAKEFDDANAEIIRAAGLVPDGVTDYAVMWIVKIFAMTLHGAVTEFLLGTTRDEVLEHLVDLRVAYLAGTPRR